MASVNLNALTEVQNPASTDNLLLFNETSNVATRIDYDKLAEAILNKTRNEIGGVSPISAIAALNSRTIPWISYDGQLEVTIDDVSFSGISTFAKSLIKGNAGKKWLTVRVNASDSAPKVEPFYGASFALTINCSSTSYGWGWLQSDNAKNQVYIGYLNTNWTWYKVGKQDDIDANTAAIADLNSSLGGWKIVRYRTSTAMPSAGEYIIPYPNGEDYGTVYGILAATIANGGYCLPFPPLTISNSPSFDNSYAISMRITQAGIAIYTGGGWGAESRNIDFFLICKT